MLRRIVLFILLFFHFALKAELYDGSLSGESYPRNLIINPILACTDVLQTTTIRNHIITGCSGINRLMIANSTGLLILNNTKIILDGNYGFSWGALEIQGDVEILGSGYTFTFSAASLLIRPNSRLKIGSGVTFTLAPTGSAKYVPVIVDSSSEIILSNATLCIDNSYGIQFTNGALVIDGNSVLDNTSSLTQQALFLGSGFTGSGDTLLRLNPGSNLIINKGALIWQNISPTSLQALGGAIEIRNTGLFVSQTELDLLGGTLGFNTTILTTTQLRSDPESLTQLTGANLNNAATTRYHRFSPDGKYLVILQADASTAIYKFNGTSLVFTASTSVFNIRSSAWTPDGRYIAFYSDGFVDIIKYNGNASLVVNSTINTPGTTGVRGQFASDGRHLYTAGGTYFYLNRFNGVTGAQLFSTTGSYFNSATSPDGLHFTLFNGGSFVDYFYYFNRIQTTLLYSENRGTIDVFTRSFFPDGWYIMNTNTSGTPYLSYYDGIKNIAVASIVLGGNIQAHTLFPNGQYVGFINTVQSIYICKISKYSMSIIPGCTTSTEGGGLYGCEVTL